MSTRPAEHRSWSSEAEEARRHLNDVIGRLKLEVREHRRRIARDERRQGFREHDGHRT